MTPSQDGDHHVRAGAHLSLAVAIAIMAGCSTSSTTTTTTTPETDPAARQAAVTDPGTRPSAEVVDKARELVDTGREEEAIRLLALAIERNPTLTVARVELGTIYRDQGDLRSAERTFSEAVRVDPRNFDAQYGYGLVLHLMDRAVDAIRAYLRALAIRPDDVSANLNLSAAYLQISEPAQALPYAERVVELDPLSGQGRANLGATYSALARYDEAVREYEAASELMELSPKLLLDMGDSLGRIGRYEEMANTLKLAIRIDPTAPTYERLGFALFKQRKFADADAAFRDALLADKAHFPAINGLAVCLLNKYLATGKTDTAVLRQAIDLLRQSLRINRDQPKIVELLSRYG
jgi:tetratricopeptide (TPR) repeat protein